jgi:hypothetical protein
MSRCSHITKVLEFGFDENHDFKATLYGCVLCDWSSTEPYYEENIFIDHTLCGDECFGCKARGLQLNTGDASSQKAMSNKKWDSELNEYRKARSEGIQPTGTSMEKIQEARRASEVMGTAYNADIHTKTDLIQNNTVDKLKEVGLV